MGYGLDGRGSIPGRGKEFFSSPQRSDWLWDPSSLLSNGYWGQRVKRQAVKLTTHFNVVPKSRIELYLHSPICIHGIVLN
jgi:hypothetical protein